MDKYKIKNYLSTGAKGILLSIAVIFALRSFKIEFEGYNIR
jgi:hypothetical protein